MNVDIGQVPEHGTASFTVTMTCLKATLTAASNYRYTLIGDCNFDCVSAYMILTSATVCHLT